MAARKKKAGRPSRISKMYPEGTPVDDAGAALTGVEIEGTPGMPLDAESARTTERHRETMKRKAAGEKRIKWNDEDPRIRYQQCLALNPACGIAIRQLFPIESAVDGRSATMVSEYEKLITHIKNTHWDGEEATYEWKAYTKQHPQLAVGTISFKADPTWATRKATTPQEPDMSQQQPPGWGPPPGWPPPYAGYPPGPGYPQPGYPYPQAVPQPPLPVEPQAPLPQAPPPTQAAPAQAPPPPPPMPVPQMPAPQQPSADPSLLLNQLMELTKQNALMMEEIRQLRSGQPAAPVPVVPTAAGPTPQEQYQQAYYKWWMDQQHNQNQQQPPQPPPNPLEQVSGSVDLMTKISTMGKEFAKSLIGPETPTEEEKKKEGDDFPIKVKDLGPIRLSATPEGDLMTDATSMFLMNTDKISENMKAGLKEIRGMLKDRSDAVAQQAMGEDKKAEMRKAKLEEAERFAAAMERIKKAQMPQGHPPPMPPPPPQQVQAPPPQEPSLVPQPQVAAVPMTPATPVFQGQAVTDLKPLVAQDEDGLPGSMMVPAQETPIPTPVEPHAPTPPAPKPDPDITPVEVPRPSPPPVPEPEEKQEETPQTPPQENTQSA